MTCRACQPEPFCRAPEMSLKTFVRSPPSVNNTDMIATLINPAIRPYSIAVTPASFLAKEINIPVLCLLLIGAPKTQSTRGFRGILTCLCGYVTAIKGNICDFQLCGNLIKWDLQVRQSELPNPVRGISQFPAARILAASSHSFPPPDATRPPG
jgi:hypothetical protein